MLKTFSAIAALTLAAGGAQAAVVTFDDLTRGDTVSSISVSGATGTVSVSGGGASNSGNAIVFDTTDPGTAADGDPDLGAPFYDAFTGPAPRSGTPTATANKLNPLNVLIIGEKPSADSGPDTNPDDNGRGGMISIAFDIAVTFMGFDLFDDVDGFVAEGRDGDGNLVGTSGPISMDYDNQFTSLGGLNWENVSLLTFDFKGASGAIDSLAFADPDGGPVVPVPAALPLLLAGIGGLGLLGRRRKS